MGSLLSDECLLKALDQFGILCNLNGKLSKCLIPSSSSFITGSGGLATNSGSPILNSSSFAVIGRGVAIIGRSPTVIDRGLGGGNHGGLVG